MKVIIIGAGPAGVTVAETLRQNDMTDEIVMLSSEPFPPYAPPAMLEYFMTGSLVSDDDWALKKLGISSNPSQFIFGIHPTMGVTWRYPLVVDYKFLPEKVAV